MKAWKKTSLLTTLVIIGLIVMLFYVFKLKVIGAPAGDIDFSPAEISSKVVLDSFPDKPRNIILFIADGMGFSHLSLAMMADSSEPGTSPFDQFEVRAWHDTRSSYGPLTDSGASATAMATGTITFFDAIGMDPDGNRVSNAFEVASENKYNTGIVTDSYIWDATPAAFVAHTQSRDSSRTILTQIANSDIDLIFGELEDLGEEGNPDYEETMAILTKRFQLLDESLALPKTSNGLTPIAAIYDEDEVQDLSSEPNLPRLTQLALQYLSSQDNPFALLVECEELDSGSHTNNSNRVWKGVQSIQETLKLVMEFAKANGETLVVFTSDHETGGMAVVVESNYPNMQLAWSTKDHTATVVPLLATGPGAEYFGHVTRNSDIGILLKNLIVTHEND